MSWGGFKLQASRDESVLVGKVVGWTGTEMVMNWEY